MLEIGVAPGLYSFAHQYKELRFERQALSQAVELFADDAEFTLPEAEPVKGKQAIAQLLDKFYQSYKSVQRVWKTRTTDNGIEAVWAAAGKWRNGEVFAVHGRHIAKLDQAGKIANLKVELLTGDHLATPIT
jgi:ketosteroid isomerase-like protein